MGVARLHARDQALKLAQAKLLGFERIVVLIPLTTTLQLSSQTLSFLYKPIIPSDILRRVPHFVTLPALPNTHIKVKLSTMLPTPWAHEPNFTSRAVVGSFKVVRQPHVLVMTIKVAPIHLERDKFNLDDGLSDRKAVVRLPFDPHPCVDLRLQYLAQIQGRVVLNKRAAASRFLGIAHRKQRSHFENSAECAVIQPAAASGMEINEVKATEIGALISRGTHAELNRRTGDRRLVRNRRGAATCDTPSDALNARLNKLAAVRI